MAKHGREIWARIDRPEFLIENDSYYHLKPEATPPELLKMSQYPLQDLPTEVWGHLVSEKKALSLTEYYNQYCKIINGKVYNTAALLSKYRTLHKAECLLP